MFPELSKRTALALLADPEALENRVGLATLALSRGDLPGALLQYDAIVAKRPKLADAQLGRSFVLMGLGRYPEGPRGARRSCAPGRRTRASCRLSVGSLPNVPPRTRSG